MLYDCVVLLSNIIRMGMQGKAGGRILLLNACLKNTVKLKE